MRTISPYISLLVVMCCIMVAGCDHEQVIEPDSVFAEKTAIPVKENHSLSIRQIVQSQNNLRVPISYEGALCPGQALISDAVPMGWQNGASPMDADYYDFQADAGQTVTITVNRISCEMDPIMVLYAGSGDTDALTFLTGSDDDGGSPDGCDTACFAWGEPQIAYPIVNSGAYTVAVWDYQSCGSDLSYSIVATGQSFCFITIDGCNTGIISQQLPDGTTMQEAIDACAMNVNNQGQFVGCVLQLAAGWKKDGLITPAELRAIIDCARSATIP